MSIFSNLFGQEKPLHNEPNQFPPEGDKGSAKIKGDRIICKGEQTYQDSEINISDLEYVYLVTGDDQGPRLFLFDHYQHHIPVNYKGFKEVYLFLSGKFGFKDEVFFKCLEKKGFQKKEIWRKSRVQNYQILDDQHHKDYAHGFEIQSPEKEFISWDTTYNILNNNPNLHFHTTAYGQKTGIFKYPVRLGNILLENLEFFFDNVRTDVPVLRFFTSCYTNSSDDGSYHILKSRLIKDLGKSKSYYERSDQNYYNFNIEEMWISLVYTYDSHWQFNGGYTSLSIENHREYPYLLYNSAYEDKMSVDQTILLDATIKTPSDYKKNPSIKSRPVKLDLDFHGHTVIWKDLSNEKIGFSDDSYAQIFDLKNIKSFSIENMLPAKGGGAGYLNIRLSGEQYNKVILTGDCHELDGLAESLAALSGKTVTFEPEYYNC